MLRLRRSPVQSAGYLMAALVVVAVLGYSFIAGRHLDATNIDAKLGAAPFVGKWHWRYSRRSVLSLGVVVFAVVVLPIVGRWRTWAVVALSSVTATVFGWSLAVIDGWSAVVRPVVDKTEYWADIQHAKPFTVYLRTYVDQGLYHSVHVRGHPPGMALLLIVMKAAHLRSPWAAAALFVVSIAVTVLAVSVVVWRLLGEAAAGSVAPLLAIAPFAIWQVTSADSFFCAVAAVSLALTSVAATSHGFVLVLSALSGGIVGGLFLHLTYGAPTLLLPVAAAIAIVARKYRWIAVFGLGVVGVALIFRHGGFWWPTGFKAVRVHYWAGTAKFRPWRYFIVANLAVLMLAVGLPVVMSLVRVVGNARTVKWGRFVVLPVAALAGALAADVSQMSKGETERIWLMFMPWLAVSGLAVVRSSRSLRLWIGCQGLAGIVLQSALVSKW